MFYWFIIAILAGLWKVSTAAFVVGLLVAVVILPAISVSFRKRVGR